MTPEEFKAIGEAACVSVAASHDAVWTGNRLEPALWEAFRVELQRRFRRSTGEEQAVLSVDLTPAAPTDHVMGSDLYQTDEEIRQWIAACNHEPAKASLRHYLDIRTSAETEQNRLRRMVERRDEFIIANGLWDAFKEASREAE